MLPEFEKHLKQSLPFLQKKKLLVAISGGLDSVVLTHLCHKLNLNIALAHCNFNLRGDESDGDEQFVIDLADKLNLEVFIQNFDTKDYAKTNKQSTQMAARELRYQWFEELSKQLHFDYILTAHHADDNLETLLINLSRGTGLEGLTGIPEINQKLCRPLLSFSRTDIENYAKQNGLRWREDTSNASDKYLRNALRHHIVPKFKELNPKLLQNTSKTIDHLKDSEQIINDRIEVVERAVISKEDNGNLGLDISEIKKLSNPKAYLFWMLKDFGFTEWNDVTDLLEAQSGKQVLSSTYRLVKDRNRLILNKIVNTNNAETRIETQQNEIKTEQGIFCFNEVKTVSEKHANVIYVDKDLLNFPLNVRRWREGDYFYPFGMKGKKKLSKFFKDEKLSLPDKEDTLLLCSKDAIVWVINRRADDRFKVKPTTREILKITFKE